MKDGINETEYIETLLAEMGTIVQQGNASGGMVGPEKLAGLQNLAGHIQEHIAKLAQDKNEKQRVREYGKVLGQLMNFVKAFAQRLQEAMGKQNGQGGMDPKDAAKIQAMQAQSQAKIANMKESHAQRTAQRKIQFEQELQLDREKHKHEVAKDKVQMHADVEARDLEAAGNIHRENVAASHEIRRNRLKSVEEE